MAPQTMTADASRSATDHTLYQFARWIAEK
jgi:hypothetical protein